MKGKYCIILALLINSLRNCTSRKIFWLEILDPASYISKMIVTRIDMFSHLFLVY